MRRHGFSGATVRALRRAVRLALRPWTKPRTHGFAFHYDRVLGTSFELQLVAKHAEAAHRAEHVVLAEVDRLEKSLSGWADTSELSCWQQTRGVEAPVSPELAEVLELGEDWRIWTAGAFNPAAVSFGDLLHVSDVSDRLDAMRQPLWTVDRERGVACRLTLLPVSLDALAKGYIVDRVAACACAVEGVTQVLVNIGGDLRHLGDRAISASVTDPRAPAENAAPIATVRLCDEALATSGGYRRGHMVAGRAVSHILDPRTGRPAAEVISASVIAPDCATADALSTAFSVLTPAESVALADSLRGVGCMMVEQDGTITTNDTWLAHAAT
ncbi:MAG: FAD:protein FMN transferase [Gemmatimonadaceae bacterium]